MRIWLITIQNFLLPYWKKVYFSIKGAFYYKGITQKKLERKRQQGCAKDSHDVIGRQLRVNIWHCAAQAEEESLGEVKVREECSEVDGWLKVFVLEVFVFELKTHIILANVLILVLVRSCRLIHLITFLSQLSFHEHFIIEF